EYFCGAATNVTKHSRRYPVGVVVQESRKILPCLRSRKGKLLPAQLIVLHAIDKCFAPNSTPLDVLRYEKSGRCAEFSCGELEFLFHNDGGMATSPVARKDANHNLPVPRLRRPCRYDAA